MPIRPKATGNTCCKPGQAAWAGMLVLLLAFSLLAGCTKAGLSRTAGGVSPEKAEKASLVVAQTRAQFQKLSALSLPFRIRKFSRTKNSTPPELALVGRGTRVTPGIQKGQQQRLKMALYLEKQNHADGYAMITLPGSGKQTWPIVAYDLLGKSDGDFDFLYQLVDPEGRLRYLVVIGGRYTEKKKAYIGFEGTLIYPGKNQSLDNWESAYKINFGYKFAEPPTFQSQVKQADDLFSGVGKNLERLDKYQKDIDFTRNRRDDSDGKEKNGGALKDSLESLQNQRKALMENMEDDLLQYFKLRERISNGYAAFVGTNQYRWKSLEGKRKYYDAWKTVEFHHPRIEERVNRFVLLGNKGERVLAARKKALEVVTRNNNWARQPVPSR